MVFDAEDIDHVALRWNDVGEGVDETVDLWSQELLGVEILELDGDAAEQKLLCDHGQMEGTLSCHCIQTIYKQTKTNGNI